MDDVTLLASKDEKIGEKALIVNFSGFLDFNTRFIAEGLEKRGTVCRIESVKLDEVELLRKNPAEMRSMNIARVMSDESQLEVFCDTRFRNFLKVRMLSACRRFSVLGIRSSRVGSGR